MYMKHIETHKRENHIFYESHMLFSSQAVNHPSQSTIFGRLGMFTKEQPNSSSAGVSDILTFRFSKFPGITHELL